MIIEKDISQVAVGSYVVDIVKQTGHFKIKNPGWVRDFHAIEYLIHQGVQRVKVDTSKKLSQRELSAETIENLAQSQIKEEKPQKKPSEHNAANKRTATTKRLLNTKQFSERLTLAKEVYDEAKNVQANVLKSIKQNQPVDTKPVKEFVDQSIDIIFENSDALACVLNIRIKDEYLLEHSVSVSILMTIFAGYLGFERNLTQQLAIGAFLHDVGKVKVPDKILNKPGKLTESEFEEIKKHAVFSKEIVNETKELSAITKQVVANHHEKLNGKGYPLGLKEADLTTYDRMISICDIFDALTADRVYKAGIPHIRAFAILRELAQENHLDKSLVDQFIKCLGVYPVGSLVKLSTERLAIVEAKNLEQPTKPHVKSFFSLTQNTFTETRIIDLSHSAEEQIEKGVCADEFDLDMQTISEYLMLEA
ncbi:MAG: HD-GYP domain-containing protein [Kangiellaceae bacterium]|nr:HD-GYP domain-containing protein [Kangiellaceae bacterium]MCW9000750.1 HD-GYP domain-containing protein [Kangiellaceae bacterium]